MTQPLAIKPKHLVNQQRMISSPTDQVLSPVSSLLLHNKAFTQRKPLIPKQDISQLMQSFNKATFESEEGDEEESDEMVEE